MRRLLACAVLCAPLRAWAVSCSFVGGSPTSFGAYDVFAASPLDTAGSITLVCTSVTALDNVTVELSQGGASSFSPRRVTGAGGRSLAYNLYLDAARTAVWGDGSGGTAYQGPFNPPDGSNVTLTVYGRMPAGQSAPAGSYSDTIVATINY